jgi:hypothetical protein
MIEDTGSFLLSLCRLVNVTVLQEYIVDIIYTQLIIYMSSRLGYDAH